MACELKQCWHHILRLLVLDTLSCSYSLVPSLMPSGSFALSRTQAHRLLTQWPLLFRYKAAELRRPVISTAIFEYEWSSPMYFSPVQLFIFVLISFFKLNYYSAGCWQRITGVFFILLTSFLCPSFLLPPALQFRSPCLEPLLSAGQSLLQDHQVNLSTRVHTSCFFFTDGRNEKLFGHNIA